MSRTVKLLIGSIVLWGYLLIRRRSTNYNIGNTNQLSKQNQPPASSGSTAKDIWQYSLFNPSLYSEIERSNQYTFGVSPLDYSASNGFAYPRLADYLSNTKEVDSSQRTWPSVKSLNELEYYAQFANIAYRSAPYIRKWKCPLCLNFTTKPEDILTLELADYRVQFVSLSVLSRREIVIAVRGSCNGVNWISNMKFNHAPFPPPASSTSPKSATQSKDSKASDSVSEEEATVHAGFKQLADAHRPQIRRMLKKLLEQYPGFNVVFVGHSMGGAIITLSSIYAQADLNLAWDKISVYTFGQPRVGNAKFAEWYTTLPINYHRVVNNRDPVPHLPPYDLNYRHVGPEIFRNPDDQYTLCASNALTYESDACSASSWGLPSIDDHLSLGSIRFE